MGLTKTAGFSKAEIELAEIARALAHPARIAILKHLIDRKSCICGDIVDELPLSQSTVSQHLKELKEAGIIKGTISGTSICYCIDEKVWQKAGKALTQLFESYSIENTCC
ncbi:MAG: metalloregulator ArsR/SmtB family transcription factor [Cyclobacteriaceae bacterium]|jgi:DNA-binding transcriptional ArsR family regulator|nr:metalloregulator ArsR/SmtB family transcription factor [Cyclobacteriaceae bacterium]